jgi:hypothetical protein
VFNLSCELDYLDRELAADDDEGEHDDSDVDKDEGAANDDAAKAE